MQSPGLDVKVGYSNPVEPAQGNNAVQAAAATTRRWFNRNF